MDMPFAIEVEGGIDRRKINNSDEIKSQIVEKLELLQDRPKRTETPYVYHIDIAAMYPNIILTNRLQPSTIINDATCASCDFNHARNGCKRRMQWTWRDDYNPATKGGGNRAKDQLTGRQRWTSRGRRSLIWARGSGQRPCRRGSSCTSRMHKDSP